jgi:hypothetical protein
MAYRWTIQRIVAGAIHLDTYEAGLIGYIFLKGKMVEKRIIEGATILEINDQGAWTDKEHHLIPGKTCPADIRVGDKGVATATYTITEQSKWLKLPDIQTCVDEFVRSNIIENR